MNSLAAKIIYRAGLIRKIRTSVPVIVNGRRFLMPLINGMGYDNLQISEMWMCELLSKVLPLKKGVFVDIGVNVGQTLVKLKSVNDQMEYIGFEPNPSCVYYTEALIKANQFKNCRLIPAGLYDRDTVLELNLYSDEDTDISGSLIGEFRVDSKVHQKIYVPVYRFEELSRQLGIGTTAVIKIDVEGAELEVLQSLQEVIHRDRPILLMEILPCYEEKNTERVGRQQKLEALLKQTGYRILRVLKTASGHSLEKLVELETIGIHSNTDWCEYVLVPAETNIDSLNVLKA